MDLELVGKSVIVTGGANGLGFAICQAFANEGANVTIFDISKKDSSSNPDFFYEVGDVSCSEDIDRALMGTVERFGRLDILVNNAGIWPNTPFIDISMEEWEKTIRVNLSSHFLFTQKFVKYLITKKSPGQIVNIVSPVAFQGTSGGHSHYAAAKAGLVSLTQSLARELADYKIRVLAVAPGLMRTNMTETTLSERGDQYYLKRIPLGRFAELKEIAEIVVFVASERASYVTGATIDVSGGMLMR